MESTKPLIVDGGLATELETLGHDLDHPLWSAKLLIEDPDSIKKVHRRFLAAGAEVLVTSSYQLSYLGAAKIGITAAETTELLKLSVRLAREAITEHYAELGETKVGSEADRFQVAASIGPYGAYLADGSEYTGEYEISDEQLRDFHEKRLGVILSEEPDILACETIPSIREAETLKDLVARAGSMKCWVSFSCRDGQRISDGTPIEDCVRLLRDAPQVFAIGVNCTDPRFVEELIRRIKAVDPDKQVVVYPNSGERYEARTGSWKSKEGSERTTDLIELAPRWVKAGANIIGGCCRVGPDEIGRIRSALS